MPSVLIAGLSTRAAAASAVAAGFAVTAVDAFGDLDVDPSVRAVSLPRDLGIPFSADGISRSANDDTAGRAGVSVTGRANSPCTPEERLP